MASDVVSVNVKLDENAPEKIYKLPQTKGALTKYANEIASSANSLGAGFRTKKVHIDGKEVGGTQPRYVSEKAIETKGGSVAIVHPKNYAAMKDNHLHNTLLKSMKRG